MQENGPLCTELLGELNEPHRSSATGSPVAKLSSFRSQYLHTDYNIAWVQDPSQPELLQLGLVNDARFATFVLIRVAQTLEDRYLDRLYMVPSADLPVDMAELNAKTRDAIFSGISISGFLGEDRLVKFPPQYPRQGSAKTGDLLEALEYEGRLLLLRGGSFTDMESKIQPVLEVLELDVDLSAERVCSFAPNFFYLASS